MGPKGMSLLIGLLLVFGFVWTMSTTQQITGPQPNSTPALFLLPAPTATPTIFDVVGKVTSPPTADANLFFQQKEVDLTVLVISSEGQIEKGRVLHLKLDASASELQTNMRIKLVGCTGISGKYLICERDKYQILK